MINQLKCNLLVGLYEVSLSKIKKGSMSLIKFIKSKEFLKQLAIAVVGVFLFVFIVFIRFLIDRQDDGTSNNSLFDQFVGSRNFMQWESRRDAMRKAIVSESRVYV